jgi:hypothetical protein
MDMLRIGTKSTRKGMDFVSSKTLHTLRAFFGAFSVAKKTKINIIYFIIISQK